MSSHTSKGKIFLTEGIKYDDLRCKGKVTAASSFDFKGKNSAGNISAQDVKILTGSDGKAGTITGGAISGSDIELYGVTCRTVSGKNITLKGGCHVDTVSYSGLQFCLPVLFRDKKGCQHVP